jgi:hypothetical protein
MPDNELSDFMLASYDRAEPTVPTLVEDKTAVYAKSARFPNSMADAPCAGICMWRDSKTVSRLGHQRRLRRLTGISGLTPESRHSEDRRRTVGPKPDIGVTPHQDGLMEHHYLRPMTKMIIEPSANHINSGA